jgi:hypothetical protein
MKLPTAKDDVGIHMPWDNRRLSGKAPKRRHIEIFLRLGNKARQDASAHKMGKLFLRGP